MEQNNTPAKQQPLEKQLMIILQGSTVADIALRGSDDARMILIDIQSNLTREKALNSPVLSVLTNKLGKSILIKLIVFIIKSFQDSLKVKDEMDVFDILEASELIAETYSHDSLKDIMLAFKEAKKDGRKFYNALSQPDIFDILKGYFDKKALWLENRHKDVKATGESNGVDFVNGLAERAPLQLEQMSKMINPNHVNREHLRLKQTIQKAKAKRGLS